MRVLIQRVSHASVTVDGRLIGQIGAGLLLFVGFAAGDTVREVAWMAEKIAGLRLFSDDEGKMNRSVIDAGGSILLVSQFTLYGDVSKGSRPSFIDAARPGIAIPLYERFIDDLRSTGVTVATGEFGANMAVSLLNDGPVTLLAERSANSD